MSTTASEPLLERGAAITAAGELLADAGASRGRLMLIEAPAGLGKSTLVEHTARTAAAKGFVVLRAAGHELERALGWGVARSLFEAWLLSQPDAAREALLTGPPAPCRILFEPDAAVGLPRGSEASFGILHALYWLAVRVSEAVPLLLVIDDAHWADEPSLRFLAYLVGRLREQQIAVLVATRPMEGADAGPLELVHADPTSSVCGLAPLSLAAVTELVHRRVAAADAQLCSRCHELTSGNPLQVRELVSAITLEGGAGTTSELRRAAERASRSLSRSVLRRLASMSAAAQSLARAAAVFDGRVALYLVAEVAGIRPEVARAAAEELARADILDGGEPLAFVHPLLREAVYGALPGTKRGELHSLVARKLAQERAPSEQVGAHLLEATPAGDDTIVEHLRQAAASAMAHGVPVSAIAYLRRALSEPPSLPVRADVLAELGEAELVGGRGESIEHLEAAIRLADDPRRRAELALGLGRTLHDFGRPEDACAACEAGLRELGANTGEPGADTSGPGADTSEPGADTSELALDLQAAYLTSAVVVPERAREAHRRAGAIMSDPGRGATRAERTLLTKAMIMQVYAGNASEQAGALASRLLHEGRLITEDGLSSQALAHMIITLSFCDRYEAAEEALRAAGEEIRRGGWVTWRAACLMLRARQRIWTGPVQDAVEDARAAVDALASGVQMYLPSAVCVLVRALLERDDLDQAAEVLSRLDAGRAPVGPFAAWRHEAAGRLAAERGQHAEALEAFLACGEQAERVLIKNPALFHWRSEAALAAHRSGDPELAQRLIAAERELAQRFGAPRAIGVAMRAAGMLERGEEAVRLLGTSADILHGCGATVEHAHTLAELGAAVRRAGRPTEARAALRTALGVAEQTGAAAVSRRADDELVRAGGHPPARRDSDGDLTPSERRVAELAVAGRTNREIANELFVTVKAVEWHLGNTYRKLDLRGRRELAGKL